MKKRFAFLLAFSFLFSIVSFGPIHVKAETERVAPTVNVTLLPNNEIDVTWNDTGAASYYIYIYDVEAQSALESTGNNVGKKLSAHFQLSNGHFRAYVTAVYNSSIMKSGDCEFIIDQVAPTVNFTLLPNNIINISWNDTHATSYYVYIYDLETGAEVEDTGRSTGRNLSALYQLSDGYYRAYVTAVYSESKTESGYVDFQVYQTIDPIAPTVTATLHKKSYSTELDITWNDTGASSYYVYLYDPKIQEVIEYTGQNVGRNLYHQYTLYDDFNGKTVRAVVTAVYTEAQMESGYAEVSLKAPSAPAIDPLSNSTVTSGSSVTFNWDPVPETDKYWVWICDPDENEIVSGNIGNTVSYTNHFNAPGSYRIVVTAINQFGQTSSAPYYFEIVMVGDINGDGKLNSRDVLALMKLALSTNPEVTETSDLNGDGKINSRDVIALMKLVLTQA